MRRCTQNLPFHALFADGSESCTAGTLAPVLRAKVPGNESCQERKFHTWNIRCRERVVWGAKRPVTISTVIMLGVIFRPGRTNIHKRNYLPSAS